MSAINNLKGHIVKDGKVVYSEELEPHIIFAVIQLYEPKYEKHNYSNCSRLLLKTIITTGEKYIFSNGVESLIDAERIEEINEDENFETLREIKTLQGFKVWESSFGENNYLNTKKIKKKSRKVKWIVEVPKNELVKFFIN